MAYAEQSVEYIGIGPDITISRNYSVFTFNSMLLFLSLTIGLCPYQQISSKVDRMRTLAFFLAIWSRFYETVSAKVYEKT
jgi:hypothetical protein